MKFIRCFCYGLEPGDTVLASVEGQAVTFSHAAAQVDVPLAPTVEASIPAVEPVPAPPAVEPVPAPPAVEPVSDIPTE
jgi:hypothetical protein